MNATNAWRGEMQEKAERDARYGEKPEDLTDEEWELVPDSIRKQVSEGQIDRRELEMFLENARKNREQNQNT